MQPVWRSLGEFTVSAKPEGIWTKVLDYVGPSRKLRFTATGKWAWQDAKDAKDAKVGKHECGPDGDAKSQKPANALSADALLGALIGKIGGSSAAVNNTSAFPVGSYCVIDVDDKTKGPLYLTINDAPDGLDDNSGELTVSIWESW